MLRGGEGVGTSMFEAQISTNEAKTIRPICTPNSNWGCWGAQKFLHYLRKGGEYTYRGWKAQTRANKAQTYKDYFEPQIRIGDARKSIFVLQIFQRGWSTNIGAELEIRIRSIEKLNLWGRCFNDARAWINEALMYTNYAQRIENILVLKFSGWIGVS